jgi:hypothetical protein
VLVIFDVVSLYVQAGWTSILLFMLPSHIAGMKDVCHLIQVVAMGSHEIFAQAGLEL